MNEIKVETSGQSKLRQFLNSLLRVLGWIVLGLWGLYMIGAFYYDMRLGMPAGITALVYVAVMTAIVVMMRGYRRMAAWAAVCVVVTLPWLNIEPSNDRVWVPDKAVLAEVEFDGDRVTIRNMRDANYPEMGVSEPEYIDLTFDLSTVVGMDMMISYWGSDLIAHPMLSWRFEGGRSFTISVETRNELDEPYSTLGGFYRQYELIYVVSTDRDSILRRSMYEEDDDQVYMYKLSTDREAARGILESYLEAVNYLRDNPVWYNTLLDNCTSHIRFHETESQENVSPWNWGIVLPGSLPGYLYNTYIFYVDDLSFEELRDRGHLNPKANDLGRVDDFWQQIRESVPGFDDDPIFNTDIESDDVVDAQ